MTKIFITGSTGDIGFSLTRYLLCEGACVHGYDRMTDCHDADRRRRRHETLRQCGRFAATDGRLEDAKRLNTAVDEFEPHVIVHLAAQVGLLYSLANPPALVTSDPEGTGNVMAAARRHSVDRLLVTHDTSPGGLTESMPLNEQDPTASPAGTVPTTVVRYATVYGASGRPDLALYKLVGASIDGRRVDFSAHEEMPRDFTGVDTFAQSIRTLIDGAPARSEGAGRTAL